MSANLCNICSNRHAPYTDKTKYTESAATTCSKCVAFGNFMLDSTSLSRNGKSVKDVFEKLKDYKNESGQSAMNYLFRASGN